MTSAWPCGRRRVDDDEDTFEAAAAGCGCMLMCVVFLTGMAVSVLLFSV